MNFPPTRSLVLLCPAFVAALVGLLSLPGRPARAAFTPQTFEARRTTMAPVIDGSLADPVWATAQTIAPFFAYQSGGAPAAAETELRLLWDDQYLYVAIHAADQNIRSSCSLTGACGHDASLFNGDVVELFLRESTSQVRYHEFEWSPRGEDFDARFDTRFGAPGTSWESGLLSAVTVQGTVDQTANVDMGWNVESRIPLAAFSSLVDVGTQWTFTGARYDYFNATSLRGPALMMSTRGDPTAPQGGVTNGFHTYEIYDNLAFVGTPVPEPATISSAVLVALGILARRTPCFSPRLISSKPAG